jgi:hypothetical protein
MKAVVVLLLCACGGALAQLFAPKIDERTLVADHWQLKPRWAYKRDQVCPTHMCVLRQGSCNVLKSCSSASINVSCLSCTTSGAIVSQEKTCTCIFSVPFCGKLL